MPRPSAGPVVNPDQDTLSPTYPTHTTPMGLAVPDVAGHDLVSRVAGAEEEWDGVDDGDYSPADSHYIPVVKMGRKADGTGGIAVGDNDAMVTEAQFVLAARGQSRIRFDGRYNAKDPKAPVCRSADGITPDSSIPNPPSDRCATCPWSFEAMLDRETASGEQRCQRNEEALVYLADTSAGLRVARIRFGGMAATTFRRYWSSFADRIPRRPPVSVVTRMNLIPIDTDNGTFLNPAFTRDRALTRSEAQIFIDDRAGRVDQWRTAISTDNSQAAETVDTGEDPFDGEQPFADEETGEIVSQVTDAPDRDKAPSTTQKTSRSDMPQNTEYADVIDQGCEFCDHMVTDRLDMPEDREFHGRLAHFWVCGQCWNEHWVKHHGVPPIGRSEAPDAVQ